MTQSGETQSRTASAPRPVRFRAGAVSTRIARRERGRPAERIVRFSLHDGKAIEVGMSVALGEWLAAALGADDAAPRRGRPAKGAPA